MKNPIVRWGPDQTWISGLFAGAGSTSSPLDSGIQCEHFTLAVKCLSAYADFPKTQVFVGSDPATSSPTITVSGKIVNTYEIKNTNMTSAAYFGFATTGIHCE